MSIDPPYTAELAERRLPGTDPADEQQTAQGPVLQGRDRGGHLERQDRRLPVLVQHPGAVVPQVLRGEDRPRHEQAGHLGPDHHDRLRQRRDRRGPGQQVRGLRRLDQRADLRRRRLDRGGRRQGRRRHGRRQQPGRRRRREGDRRAGPLQGRAARPDDRPGGPGRQHVRRRPAGRSWSTGPTSGTTTTRPPRTSPRTSATRCTPRPSTGKTSRPPYGGIGIGVSAYSNHIDDASKAAALHRQAGEPGHQRRADRQHAGQRRRATRTPSCRSSTRPSC